MKNNILKLVGLSFILLINKTFAQDVHYSQFYESPLTLNPALTAKFDGAYRISAIYRNQGFTIINKYVYQTPSISFDIPFLKKRLKNAYLGAGVLLLNDRQGSGRLNNNTGALSLAYHQLLGAKKNHQLSIGLQGAAINKNFIPANFTFFDQLNPDTYNPTNPTAELFEKNNVIYPDVRAGLIWDYLPSKNTNIFIGVAGHNLLLTKEKFDDGSSRNLYMRFTAHAGAKHMFTERFSFLPDVIYMRQGSQSQLNLGAQLGYNFSKNVNNKLAAYLGAWYRMNDAVIPKLTFEINNLHLGMAYDITTSDLKRANNSNGAFEISLAYTAVIVDLYPTMKTLPCRRF